jgi:hypothetical protein
LRLEVDNMAKKKGKPKPEPEPPRLRNIVVLRGTDEWKTWLDEVASANSAPLTVTIEQALKAYAEKLGVRKPPRRVP